MLHELPHYSSMRQILVLLTFFTNHRHPNNKEGGKLVRFCDAN